MQRSGAMLREVGTTNRTHIDDYRDAINERTRVLLRVHPSNFRMTGFTARPELSELVELGRERGIPVYEDLGSGCIVDLRAYGVDEPLAQDSLAAGANLVSFSGDKLLGGPQAGIIAGRCGTRRAGAAQSALSGVAAGQAIPSGDGDHAAAHSARRVRLHSRAAHDPDDRG